MSQEHYIFLGGSENLRHWVKNPAFRHDSFGRKNEQWFWSANQHVKSGDIGYIYLTAPLSRIVGEVDVVGDPFFHHAGTMFDNPHMADKWCVAVANPRYYGDYENPQDSPLSMKNLRTLFGVDWGWVRYPRGNTRVPDEILPALQELIRSVTDARST